MELSFSPPPCAEAASYDKQHLLPLPYLLHKYTVMPKA